MRPEESMFLVARRVHKIFRQFFPGKDEILSVLFHVFLLPEYFSEFLWFIIIILL